MWPVWGVLLVYSPWWGSYPPLQHLHRAAGSCFGRTVIELAKGHVRFKHNLHIQFRFTHQPLFSVVFPWGDLKCHGRIVGGSGCLCSLGGSWWGELCRVSLCAEAGLFAGVLLTQSGAVCLTQVLSELHSQSARNLSHNVKVL